ncbi:hypothetical protein T484DRAFT_1957932, partial [Baffinella frigidus]
MEMSYLQPVQAGPYVMVAVVPVEPVPDTAPIIREFDQPHSDERVLFPGFALTHRGEHPSGEHETFDPRYAIPPDIALPLLFSSQLILLQAIAAAVVASLGAPPSTWAVAVAAFLLWFTSTNHWRSPEPSWRGYIDRTMVGVTLIVGTVVMVVDATPSFLPKWFGGWAVVAFVFATNELQFAFNKAKTRRDYTVNVWIHLVAVHLFGNVISAGALVALWDAR